ncbi:MAG: substrate-binding domain-containing protein [Clostridia bacterium]|nr:substrate-binding domain-containing protein [Clostridia bacterium]
MKSTEMPGAAIKKNYTIGYLDENAYDEYHSYITAGLYEAAQKHGLNIIRVGHFDAHVTSRDSYQVNMLLDHLEQYPLDGLIFLGWGRAVTQENHENFKKRFGSIPLVSLGAGYPDIPSVYFAGEEYTRDILLHLIQIHHFKKIAFIAPFWTDGRVDVYKNTMEQYGIYDPKLLVSAEEIANLEVPQRGRKAVSILLDERKVSFDAVVSLFNDETKAVVDELQSRGLDVPGDVAVTSYEDGEIGKYSSPAFTTVYFPWKELGYFACEKMAHLLKDGSVPVSMATAVPGKMIIRDSCGCTTEAVRKAGAGKVDALSLRLEDVSEAGMKEIRKRIQEKNNCSDFDIEDLITAFLKDFHEENQQFFLETLDLLLKKYLQSNRLPEIEDLVSVLRKSLLPYLIPYLKTEKQKFLCAENILQQAQVLIQEKKTRAWASELVRSKSQNEVLQEISQILVTNFSVQNLMESLDINLPKLGIQNCVFLIFKNQKTHQSSSDRSGMLFQYRNGQRIPLERVERSTVKKKLDVILSDRIQPYLAIANLLHVGNDFYGFALYETGPMDERIYQSLSVNISTAISGAILLEKLDSSYKKLVEQAHREGMADLTTGILHNVGNILNSIQVTIHLIKDLVHTSPIEDIMRANKLLEENIHDLEQFILKDAKGKKLLKFYLKLDAPILDLHAQLCANIQRLMEKISLIGDIVTSQKDYAGIKSTVEELNIVSVLEDALKMNAASLEKYNIKVIKNYQETCMARANRAKLFHVLVNLIKNAKESILENGGESKEINLSIEKAEGFKRIKISDTGVGIPVHQLETIFAYGFTTKKGGHGFGLHSCANYMTEMDGRIWAESEGPGKGAAFVLQLK